LGAGKSIHLRGCELLDVMESPLLPVGIRRGDPRRFRVQAERTEKGQGGSDTAHILIVTRMELNLLPRLSAAKPDGDGYCSLMRCGSVRVYRRVADAGIPDTESNDRHF
jgi:hypothetical protein